MKKTILIIVGSFFLVLGTIATVIPLLPSFPFLLIAAISFANGSERINAWYKETKLYKNNIESYVKGHGMTRKTKLRVMTVVTLTMAVGFIMMSSIPIGRIILTFVWLVHIMYFVFGVKKFEEINMKEPNR